MNGEPRAWPEGEGDIELPRPILISFEPARFSPFTLGERGARGETPILRLSGLTEASASFFLAAAFL
jgi:hypothetical protein